MEILAKRGFLSDICHDPSPYLHALEAEDVELLSQRQDVGNQYIYMIATILLKDPSLIQEIF